MKKKLPYARSYKDLLVYQNALNLAEMVFETSKSFPKEETYALTDQLRRSSRSVGAQIAEAWGKRHYIKHFISKITDASAEIYETEHWIDISLNCHYISNEMHLTLSNQCNEISRLLGGMISKADQFCESSKN
jgi:four helix bundle protein